MNNLCLFIKNVSKNRHFIKKIEEKRESFIYKKYGKNSIDTLYNLVRDVNGRKNFKVWC